MEYLTHIVSFLTGLGAGWSLKIFVSSRTSVTSTKTTTTQKNNDVGGDMAGRDIHKQN